MDPSRIIQIKQRVQYIIEQKLVEQDGSRIVTQDAESLLRERFPHLLSGKLPERHDIGNLDDPRSLAKFIDHTLLKPEAISSQVAKLCAEARQHCFATVCVNGGRIEQAVQELAVAGSSDSGSDMPSSSSSKVGIAAVVGFPLGAMTTEAKAFEARDAIAKGATELDMVMNVGKFLDGDYTYVYRDIKALADACRERNVVLKVILETCLLQESETDLLVTDACVLCVLAGAHFVKTSTGFSTGGAKLETVKLMKWVVGATLRVKASGGVRSYQDARAFVLAGADRIGTSSGVAICAAAHAGAGAY